MKNDREKFYFFRNWLEIIEKMKDKDALEFLLSIIKYSLIDDYEPNIKSPTVQQLWLAIKPSLDKSYQNYLNAKGKIK